MVTPVFIQLRVARMVAVKKARYIQSKYMLHVNVGRCLYYCGDRLAFQQIRARINSTVRYNYSVICKSYNEMFGGLGAYLGPRGCRSEALVPYNWWNSCTGLLYRFSSYLLIFRRNFHSVLLPQFLEQPGKLHQNECAISLTDWAFRDISPFEL